MLVKGKCEICDVGRVCAGSHISGVRLLSRYCGKTYLRKLSPRCSDARLSRYRNWVQSADNCFIIARVPAREVRLQYAV